MTISLTFNEISQYIKNHSGKTISFKMISDKEVCVSYGQSIFIRTIQIPVNVTIDAVSDSSVLFSYNGGIGIDMIITGLLSFIKSKVPELNDILAKRDAHQLSLDLAKLPKARPIMDTLRLDSISVRADRFDIAAQFKN